MRCGGFNDDRPHGPRGNLTPWEFTTPLQGTTGSASAWPPSSLSALASIYPLGGSLRATPRTDGARAPRRTHHQNGKNRGITTGAASTSRRLSGPPTRRKSVNR